MKTEIYLYILEFLKLVQEKIPTTVARHRLELDENNDLCLHVIFETEGVWQTIVFDSEFCDQEPKEVVDDIVEMLKELNYKI